MQQIKSQSTRLLPFLLICLFLGGCTVEKSTPMTQVRHGETGIIAAKVSYDASISLTSSIAEGLVLWNLASNTPIYRWQHTDLQDPWLILDIADDNSFAASANSNSVTLWNLQSGDIAGAWTISDTNIRDVALSSQGTHVLIGLANAKVVVLNLTTQRRFEFKQHLSKLNSVDISVDGRFALTGSNDYVAYYWDVQSGEVIHRFVHPSRVTKVLLHPKQALAFTADASKQSRIWQLTEGQFITELNIVKDMDTITTAKFSDDGRYLLTGSADRYAQLWSATNGRLVQQWRVTPKENVKPPSAVVYGVGFLGENTVLTESSSGLNETWTITNDK